MPEFGGALDRWLEAPYVNAAAEEAEYEKWCESEDLNPEFDYWDKFNEAKWDGVE